MPHMFINEIFLYEGKTIWTLVYTIDAPYIYILYVLTQGFSQALQIPKDMCLKADEVVLQPKLAGSLQMCSLSLELPAPLNKSKKHCKQDTVRKLKRIITFLFLIKRNSIMLSILKNYKEKSIKESAHAKNEIWCSTHCRTSVLTLQVYENIQEHQGKIR